MHYILLHIYLYYLNANYSTLLDCVVRYLHINANCWTDDDIHSYHLILILHSFIIIIYILFSLASLILLSSFIVFCVFLLIFRCFSLRANRRSIIETMEYYKNFVLILIHTKVRLFNFHLVAYCLALLTVCEKCFHFYFIRKIFIVN